MDRTLRLVLTLLAVLTGLSAAPVAARMNGGESAEVERVEPSGRSAVGAIKAVVAEMGGQPVQRQKRERDTVRPRTATTVVIPSIQYSDRSRE